jgi:uncharacterized protein
MMRSLVWRRLDEPGMEIAHVESLERASGTQIGAVTRSRSGRASGPLLFRATGIPGYGDSGLAQGYELRWQLDGSRLELSVVGGASAEIGLGEADFFDVFASPLFNSLPVARDDLLGDGDARTYTMRFIRVPSLEVVPSEQRYEPLGKRRVRYSSDSFTAVIEFDADGFVTMYEGFLERIA